MNGSDRPRRGTRPSNRRDLIVAAAAELFRTRGYEHVSMGDIADAVAVGPSALYRHVSGKQQLLQEAISDGLAVFHDAMAEVDSGEPEAALRSLVQLTIANRHVATLWEREASHLPEDDQTAARTQVRQIAHRLAAMSQGVRPELTDHAADLLAWVMLAVLISPAYYRAEVTPSRQAALLAAMTEAVVHAPMSTDYRPGRPTRAVGLTPHSRREALLQKSIQLFAERRYASVGIEDIAAAVGVAGPNVYKHFASKAEILVAAFDRATAYLFMDMSDILATSATPDSALRRLIASYLAFALGHPEIVDILITEARNLPQQHQQNLRNAQRGYVEQWVRLRADCSPPVNSAAARVQVQAVLSATNWVARSHHLRSGEAIAPTVTGICERILALTEDA